MEFVLKSIKNSLEEMMAIRSSILNERLYHPEIYPSLQKRILNIYTKEVPELLSVMLNSRVNMDYTLTGTYGEFCGSYQINNILHALHERGQKEDLLLSKEQFRKMANEMYTCLWILRSAN